jgi:uncharacterized circularly permuted ATP-grasp superfamily protein/uncharacterized alpha-E superfamily protein
VDSRQPLARPASSGPDLTQRVAAHAGAGAPGHYDELRGGAGSAGLAPHWQEFFAALPEDALADMDRKGRELARQVHDNGITYNIYADRDGPQRPWSVDLFPLIIPADEWQRIESGVLQRARLLEAIIADAYGSQRLLRESLVPPALVQGHPGYLRAMQGVQPAGGRHLHILAFDLARGADGRWVLVSQRAEAPSGLGYLLENRMLVARQFALPHEAVNVRPLAGVYRELVESLKRLSPAGARSHVALLTPGPYNETYFEHAYLARELGLTLAEGGDLTVRDQRLYLRTLGGLEPVHILLKRLDDAFLDPLELRADSTLGVPGLLQAVRAGNVVMANAPGAAFLESPALLGFLPALCERLLGQKLELPALDTFWCGERAAMHEVLQRLEQGVIKPTWPGEFEPVLAPGLDAEARAQWTRRIMENPERHTVQNHLPLAQLPTWDASLKATDARAIVPRHYTLRVFALAGGRNDWYVLPGGLARIAPVHSESASMQRGGSSADVWVKASTQLELAVASSPSSILAPAARRKRLVTSRAAENLFWLGRYTERAENSVRLARLCLGSQEAETPSSQRTLTWLEDLARRHGLLPEAPASERPEIIYLSQRARRLRLERALVVELDAWQRNSGVGYNLRALKNAASTVRERLSIEQWNTIIDCVDHFERDCHEANAGPGYSSGQAMAALNHASTMLAAILGAQSDRMTRDDGWQLLSIGRHLERLGILAHALDLAVAAGLLKAPAEDGSGFAALLALFDSTITYQAQHQQSRTLPALLDLLVLDDENPRALASVTRNLRRRLGMLAGASHEAPDVLAQGVPEAGLWTLAQLCETDQDGQLSTLGNCLQESIAAAWRVSDAIGARHFTHTLDRSVGS